MKIQSKITWVVLPIIIVTLGLAGFSAYLSATSGISRLAKDLLGFKVIDLEKSAKSQWALLEENHYTNDPEMVLATQKGVEAYARGIEESETGLIFAFNETGHITMETKEIKIPPSERAYLEKLYQSQSREMITHKIGGVDRVGMGFYFNHFKWYFLVTEQKKTFYKDVDKITLQTSIIMAISVVTAIFLLFIFTKVLIAPLTKVVNTMREIISSYDLSKRVEVEYKDETGQLAQTFNIMVGELEKAYNQIKSYAFEAVLAQKKEARIRNIFQKYVPNDLIEKFFKNPEEMLVGDNRVLAILFSDIRSFTTISEGMMPNDLVNSLNRYFSIMVDIIMNRDGIVDKYIGDAIMAFFGAPIKRDSDALNSVMTGIEMAEAVKDFNAKQLAEGSPEFKIGIGINYGIVTVGNIGSERKMDYTVIGDMVNLASRLEGLTKEYGQELVISESLHMKVGDKLPCRLLDKVAVKGKSEGVKIFTTKQELTSTEKEAWAIHDEAMRGYFNQEFPKARDYFLNVGKLLKGDYISSLMAKRCEEYIAKPPGENWDGVTVMKTK